MRKCPRCGASDYEDNGARHYEDLTLLCVARVPFEDSVYPDGGLSREECDTYHEADDTAMCGEQWNPSEVES